MKTSKDTIKPYIWGNNCKGWKLLSQPTLSIIEEIMPPNTQEVVHYHQAAQQYFYILEGTATFMVNEAVETVHAKEGIYIPNNTIHQIQNRTTTTIRFLVISNSTTKDDRVEAATPPIFNYHNKYFQSVNSTENGEVTGETLFHYRQEGNIIWATYKGGSIVFGTLNGQIEPDGKLTFHYQHQNTAGEWRTGHCTSTPSLLADGRIELQEYWQWTSGDQSEGASVIREVDEKW